MTAEAPSLLTPVGELPSFVKQVGPPAFAFPAIHYWVPERSGNDQADYELGQRYFREAVALSLQPSAPFFLPLVATAMYGSFGRVEAGFLEAMIDAARVGRIAPRLTEAELAGIEADESARLQHRRLETEMHETIEMKWWLPDGLLLTALHHLSGAEGEFVGASMTLLARTALNGKRN